MNCEWRFMLSRVRRTEKAYLLYQSEESHWLYELEHCELAGTAVSLSGGLCFREFVERRKHIYYISRRKAIGFTSWSTASWQA